MSRRRREGEAGSGNESINTQDGDSIVEKQKNNALDDTGGQYAVGEGNGAVGNIDKQKVINIGAGKLPNDGAVNIDINPQADGVIKADGYDLSQYPEGEFDSVIAMNPYNYDILESDVPRIVAEGGKMTVTGNISNPYFKKYIR